MADPRFYKRSGPFTLRALADLTGAELSPAGDGAVPIEDAQPIETAGPHDITYAAGAHVARLGLAKAGAAIVPPGTVLPPTMRALHHGDPAAAFALVAAAFYPPRTASQGVSPGAHVDASARIAPGVEVAPGAVIEAGAEIGEGTIIAANAVIGQGVAIGRACQIGPCVAIGFALIGDRVLIHGGTMIGFDGFGFAPTPRGPRKQPQRGRVIIQDDVEIGANCAIDRGVSGDTIIGEGTKLDNLVHIAHNCRIGRYCLIAGQVGFAGSVVVGDGVIFAGQVGIADHVTIGDRVVAAAKSGIAKDIPAGTIVAGYPARPADQWRKEVALMSRMLKNRHRTKPSNT